MPSVSSPTAVALAVVGVVILVYAGLTGGAAIGLAVESFVVACFLLAPYARGRGGGDGGADDDGPAPASPPPTPEPTVVTEPPAAEREPPALVHAGRGEGRAVRGAARGPGIGPANLTRFSSADVEKGGQFV